MLSHYSHRSAVTTTDYYCVIDTAFDQPVNHFMVDKIQDFSFLFYGASRFNQNVSSWQTSSARTMKAMFYDAACTFPVQHLAVSMHNHRSRARPVVLCQPLTNQWIISWLTWYRTSVFSSMVPQRSISRWSHGIPHLPCISKPCSMRRHVRAMSFVCRLLGAVFANYPTPSF